MAKQARIELRLEEATKLLWQAKAKQEGITLSDWIVIQCEAMIIGEPPRGNDISVANPIIKTPMQAKEAVATLLLKQQQPVDTYKQGIRAAMDGVRMTMSQAKALRYKQMMEKS